MQLKLLKLHVFLKVDDPRWVEHTRGYFPPCGDDGITIGGMAKGVGMIHPNLATMLCFT
jgi:hypothetical protein